MTYVTYVLIKGCYVTYVSSLFFLILSSRQEAALGYPKDFDANFPDLINKRAANYRRWGMEDQVRFEPFG